MLPEAKASMDKKLDVELEYARFNKAQEELDFETMYDVLWHNACNICKKRLIAFKLTSEEICDIANDICIEILQRYKKNPSYRCKHSAAVHFAFMKVVYGKKRIEDEERKKCSQMYEGKLYSTS